MALDVDRSNNILADKRKKSPSQAEGEHIPSIVTRSAADAPSPHTRPNEIMFILVLLAIGLPIASVFELESRDFGDLRNVFYLFSNEFKMKLECHSDADASFSHTFDTMDSIGVTHAPSFNFGPTSVGLANFNSLESDSSAALTATATATILTKKNENKMKYKSGSIGQHTNAEAQPETEHSSAPVINKKGKIGAPGVESREFDNIGCIFNGGMDAIDLHYDMLSGMFIFIFIFVFVFLIVLW